MGNPLGWNDVHKVLVILSAAAGFLLAFLPRNLYLIEHPEIEPYSSRTALAHMRDVGLGYVPFAAVMIPIGINTGHASIGNFGSQGRMDYTAIGRHVNLAARLQASCEPGKILISHPTWLLVQDEIPCTAQGEIRVKGVRDPVTVYEVAPRE